MTEGPVPPPETDQLHLELDGFEGPLDLLLDLARRQRVDLARISILELVDQYVLAISASDRVDLNRAAEWLVMAAWLAWLKSRLLLPKELDETKEAEQAAQVLTDRLAQLERVKVAAAWLEARPQLGRDIFERGRQDVPPGPDVAASIIHLFEACLDVLRGFDRRLPQFYRIPARVFWTPQQAIDRLRQLLAQCAEGDLFSFVPRIAADLPDRRVRVHAAVSSTLLASLELARVGQADVRQDETFGPIKIRAIAHSDRDHEAA